MSSPLLLLAAGLIAAASAVPRPQTFQTQSVSASSGSSGSGLGNRFGGNRDGGTAFISSTNVNGRPQTFSSTTGTGTTNHFNSVGSGVGNRFGGRVPSFRPIQFRPVQFPQIGFQPFNTRFPGQNRFGSRPFGTRNRFGSSSNNRFGGSSNNLGGVNTDQFFNSLANRINRNFANGFN